MNAELLKKVRTVTPYTAGEQPRDKVIKLNTNESPYPPSPKVAEALQRMNPEDLKLYADPENKEITRIIADYHQVDANQVFVGIGSDDVIALCYLTFFNSDKPILFPDITYSFYEVWAELYNIPVKRPPLDKDFRLVKSDYSGDIGGIIFPNPNAPTGIYEELDFIEEILKANPEVVVIIDEAYVDYAKAPSACELIPKYENLIVVQTFSKSRSMAGMRIGYAVSNPRLIKYLDDVKNSFNSYTLNLPAQISGVASVLDHDYFKATINKIVETREWLKAELAALGFEYLDSAGNFIFATHKDHCAATLYDELKKRGVYVRYWPYERISEYLRITIGTKEEVQIFLNTLKEIFAL